MVQAEAVPSPPRRLRFIAERQSSRFASSFSRYGAHARQRDTQYVLARSIDRCGRSENWLLLENLQSFLPDRSSYFVAAALANQLLAKTRHQKRPAETGGRNGASIAKFRTRRPAHICETSRYPNQSVRNFCCGESDAYWADSFALRLAAYPT
jgi:hypothetical protein